MIFNGFAMGLVFSLILFLPIGQAFGEFPIFDKAYTWINDKFSNQNELQQKIINHITQVRGWINDKFSNQNEQHTQDYVESYVQSQRKNANLEMEISDIQNKLDYWKKEYHDLEVDNKRLEENRVKADSTLKEYLTTASQYGNCVMIYSMLDDYKQDEWFFIHVTNLELTREIKDVIQPGRSQIEQGFIDANCHEVRPNLESYITWRESVLYAKQSIYQKQNQMQDDALLDLLIKLIL